MTATDLYRYFDDQGRLLYVGISFSAIARAAQHKRSAAWWNRWVTMTREVHPTRRHAEIAEREAIRSEAPLHNLAHNPIGAEFMLWQCDTCGLSADGGIMHSIDEGRKWSWRVQCRTCFSRPSDTGYCVIDLAQVASVEAAEQLTKEARDMASFSTLSWSLTFEMYCNIPGAAIAVDRLARFTDVDLSGAPK